VVFLQFLVGFCWGFVVFFFFCLWFFFFLGFVFWLFFFFFWVGVFVLFFFWVFLFVGVVFWSFFFFFFVVVCGKPSPAMVSSQVPLYFPPLRSSSPGYSLPLSVAFCVRSFRMSFVVVLGACRPVRRSADVELLLSEIGTQLSLFFFPEF